MTHLNSDSDRKSLFATFLLSFQQNVLPPFQRNDWYCLQLSFLCMDSSRLSFPAHMPEPAGNPRYFLYKDNFEENIFSDSLPVLSVFLHLQSCFGFFLAHVQMSCEILSD